MKKNRRTFSKYKNTYMTIIICRNLSILDFICHDIMYFIKACDIFLWLKCNFWSPYFLKSINLVSLF